MRMSRMIASAAVALVCSACGTTPSEGAGTQQTQRATGPAQAWTRVLPWGGGAGQVARVRAATEFMAQGPSAVALAPDGAVLVLDRLNGRVLRVTDRDVGAVATVPVDGEDLAVGADGTLAVWSLLRSRVWLRDHRGADRGHVDVSRHLRGGLGITLGASRQVYLHVAHQETYRLGSPAAPVALTQVLRSKREGAFTLADGRGVAVRRRADGQAELWLFRAGLRGPQSRLALPGKVLAARVVGVTGNTACLRLERAAATKTPRIAVTRRLVCVDVDHGGVRLDRALPLPPARSYLPRRELAVGGDPARVAFVSPQADGLHVSVWPLNHGEVRP
mgnify:CR=1 FL=1